MGIIAISLKKKGMSEDPEMDSSDSGPDEKDNSDLQVSDEEIQAVKDFEDAKTSEDKAIALKAFMKLCGDY